MNGYGDFHYLACDLSGMSQGSLGVIIAVLTLILGYASYIATQKLTFIPISIAMALILAFFPVFLDDYYHVTPQSCGITAASQGSMYQQNYAMCYRLLQQNMSLYISENLNCFCTGQQPVPFCYQG